MRDAELRLAWPSVEALRELPLDPDPLSVFARQFEGVRGAAGESAEVVVDLLAASPGTGRRLRRRMGAAARRRDGGGADDVDSSVERAATGVGDFMDAMLREAKLTPGAGVNGAPAGRSPRRSTRMTPMDRVDYHVRTRELDRKLLDPDAMFEVQVLLRVRAGSNERTRVLMQGLLGAFEVFKGDNWFRVSGVQVGGAVFATAQMWGRSRSFDYRFRTGYFRPSGPRGGNWVNAREFEAFFKPPTVHCPSQNVVRAGPYLSPAPRDMPRYRGEPGVLPLGMVLRDGAEVMVGMALEEFHFGGIFGRSRQGKALACSTPIATPTGWTTMGALREGDRVFDEMGRPCVVTAVTAVMHDRECFEVEFSDGSTIVADGEHRWSTVDAAARARAGAGTRASVGLAAVRTTRDIAATLLDDAGQPNHTVGVAWPLWYDAPSTWSGSSFALPDAAAVGEQLAVHGAAHIAVAWLRLGVWERGELLTGLLRGSSVDETGSETTFSCASRQLAEDVYELVLGLGMSATLLDDAPDGLVAGEHRVSWAHPPGLRLPAAPRSIVAVRPVSSVPVRCIQVDSPSRLYLAGRACIPTHNTEMALNMLAHVATVEHKGALFFDPAVDALKRIKPFLTEKGVRERVVELDLSRRSLDARHVAWNLLSMQGLGEERLADRTKAIVDAFSIGAGWTGRSAGRTTTILTAAVGSLMRLALQLPPQLQPTIFSIRRLMRDPIWRAAAVARLPRSEGEFWTEVYAEYGNDARLPLEQQLSLLHANMTVRATFGSPASTYEPRRAMDDRLVVLAAPTSPDDNLVSGFILQAHIDAARSRMDIHDRALRTAFFVFFDEAQTQDVSTGAARGTAISVLLEQLAKYGIHGVPMAQSPHRLHEATIEALTTNASMLATTATSPQAARFFDSQWGGDVDARRAVMELERYHYILGPTHRGRRVDPFRLRGVSVDEVWAAQRNDEALPVLEQVIDAACRPRTVRETLALIEDHDDRVLHALLNDDPHDPPASRSRRDADEDADDIPDGVTLRLAPPPRGDAV